MTGPYVFEVATPLGFVVRCTRAHWDLIVGKKHPVLGMDKIRIIHDAVGHTLTVWLDEPEKEHICEEPTDEVVLMKDSAGRVIGFEFLHYYPSEAAPGLAVETVVLTEK